MTRYLPRLKSLDPAPRHPRKTAQEKCRPARQETPPSEDDSDSFTDIQMKIPEPEEEEEEKMSEDDELPPSSGEQADCQLVVFYLSSISPPLLNNICISRLDNLDINC